MATYIIGDIHGCYSELRTLLQLIKFNENDMLWSVGDIINVGPHSLKTLRFLYSLADNFNFILGNHEIGLLALAYGDHRLVDENILQEILLADDSQDLINWMLNRQLFYHHQKFNISIVHAGLAKEWSLEDAQSFSVEIGKHLQDRELYENFAIPTTDCFIGSRSINKLTFVLNVMTRARFCTINGVFDFVNKSSPFYAPAHLIPWYDVPDRKTKDDKIFFGHWGALQGKSTCKNAISLDTGCVWGGSLTIYRLDDGEVFQVSSPGYVQL